MSMKNSVVAEFGSLVRAIAIVPSVLRRPVRLVGSSAIGGGIGFDCSGLRPPWITSMRDCGSRALLTER